MTEATALPTAPQPQPVPTPIFLSRRINYYCKTPKLLCHQLYDQLGKATRSPSQTWGMKIPSQHNLADELFLKNRGKGQLVIRTVDSWLQKPLLYQLCRRNCPFFPSKTGINSFKGFKGCFKWKNIRKSPINRLVQIIP